MTACVTILARITRLPPPVERTYTQGGKRRNQAKGKGELGRLRSARSEDRPRAKAGAIKQERQMRAIRAKMIDEPPVECFHTGRPARQNGNKGQITIPILGLGSRTPNPPNAPMPGVCFAQRPQMRSSQETRFLLPVAALRRFAAVSPFCFGYPAQPDIAS